MPFDDMRGSLGDLGAFREPVRQTLEELALEMVVGGYQLLKSRVRTFGEIFWSQENRFNVELTVSMNDYRAEQLQRLERGESSTTALWNVVSAHYHPVELSGRDFTLGDDPDTLPQPDIGVYYNQGWGAPDPYLVFEGKRLNDADSRLAAEYVRNGVCRFIDGRYAYTRPSGGMLAYVCPGFVPQSVVRINNAMDRQGLSATDHLAQAGPIRGVTTIYYSRHQRTSGLGEIKLFHLLMEF